MRVRESSIGRKSGMAKKQMSMLREWERKRVRNAQERHVFTPRAVFTYPFFHLGHFLLPGKGTALRFRVFYRVDS